MSKLWKSIKEYVGVKSTPNEEVSRSHYSLVSCAEVTSDNLEMWLDLPDEVKNDPTLAPFKQFYENQNGTPECVPLTENSGDKTRLPLVNLTPVHRPNNNVLDDIEYIDGAKRVDIIEEIDDQKIPDKTLINNKKKKYASARHYTKMTILIGCWIFFTAVFMMYSEKHELTKLSSVPSSQHKSYSLPSSDTTMSVAVKLSGPFLSVHAQIKAVNWTHRMEVVLQRWKEMENSTSDIEDTKPWIIFLEDDNQIDLREGETRSTLLKFKTKIDLNQTYKYALRINTTSTQTTPFTMSYKVNPLDASTGVIYACVLLCGLYFLIIFEVINRTMAAITVATMSLAVLALAGERPTLPEIISWLDEETLLLLFSMMLLVAIMAETGIFDFLAVFTFEVTKGKLWPLIYLLCAITAILSTFLDNVTTVMLMSPVTIRLCKVMELDPVPILMLMAIYSNIGGTATPVGDPPCVIVVSNKAVAQAGINFTNFTVHMSLGIILVFIQTSLQIRYIFRDSNKLRLDVPRKIEDLKHKISIWRSAADSLPHLNKDCSRNILREILEKEITKFRAQLETLVKGSSKRACPKNTFQSTLVELKKEHKIKDKVLLVKASIAITFVVFVFFLHSIPEFNRISLAWTALLGAVLLLILADREDLKLILESVEWSTLLFFAALFVLMEALSKLGLIVYIGDLMEKLIITVDESARLAVAIMLILWVSGMISAFVDNIPLTTMMVRVVVSIGSNPHLNLPMQPLIWALLCGACLGGNGTLIGASANVVCAGVAERHGYHITFARFFKVGFPVMIGHLVMSSVYLLVCHCLFAWH